MGDAVKTNPPTDADAHSWLVRQYLATMGKHGEQIGGGLSGILNFLAERGEDVEGWQKAGVAGERKLLVAHISRIAGEAGLTDAQKQKLTKSLLPGLTDIVGVDVIINGVLLGLALMSSALDELQPVKQILQQARSKRTQFELPDVESLLTLTKRNIDIAEVKEQLERHGISYQNAARMAQGREQLLPLADVDELFRRGELAGLDDWKGLYRVQNVSPELLKFREHLVYAPPDAALLLEARRRRNISEGFYRDGLKVLGLDPTAVQYSEQTWNRLPDVAELVEAVRRGFVNEAEFTKGVERLGFKDAEVNLLKHLAVPPLDPITSTLAFFREVQTEKAYKAALKFAGVPDDYHNIITETNRPLVMPVDLLTLWHRELLDDNGLAKVLGQHGFSPDSIERMKQASFVIPGVADLVRFAVREAFTPEIVEKYELDGDLPEAFTEAAKKVGLDPEWSKMFWRAHWVLPSLQMGYEMFHRRIITRDELKLLMRTQDIMPFWRDRLLKITYVLPTRVDLRRMYRHGIITVEELVDAYEQRGYASKNAENMAQLAVKMATEEETELTRTEVLRFYKERQLSASDTKNFLKALGFATESVNLFIARIDLQRAEERKTDERKIIQTRYKRGLADASETLAALAEAGYGLEEATYWLDLWTAQVEKQTARLTKSELKKLYTEKIMTEPEVLAELWAMGYDERRAGLIIRTWTL